MRISKELKDRAQVIADGSDRSLNDVLVDAVRDYIGPEQPKKGSK